MESADRYPFDWRMHMVENIGGRIRRVRKSKGMTLNDLATGAGLSVSYISNLERNLCSPTLENLVKICTVLDVSMLKLLDNEGWNEDVVRAADREVVYEQKGEVRYESINFGVDKLNGIVISLEPHCVFDDEWTHSYDEIGYVLEGELTIMLNENTYVLNPGDCIYVPSKNEHNMSNVSDRRCISYWVKRGE